MNKKIKTKIKLSNKLKLIKRISCPIKIYFKFKSIYESQF